MWFGIMMSSDARGLKFEYGSVAVMLMTKVLRKYASEASALLQCKIGWALLVRILGIGCVSRV
jgi:hypothetical protein